MQQKLYRRTDVSDLTGLSKNAIYKFMREGRFPRPVKLKGRAVAWRKSDLDAWIASLEPA